MRNYHFRKWENIWKKKFLNLISSTIDDIDREYYDREELISQNTKKINEEYKTVRYTKQDIISYQRLAMYSVLDELYNKIKRW